MAHVRGDPGLERLIDDAIVHDWMSQDELHVAVSAARLRSTLGASLDLELALRSSRRVLVSHRLDARFTRIELPLSALHLDTATLTVAVSGADARGYELVVHGVGPSDRGVVETFPWGTLEVASGTTPRRARGVGAAPITIDGLAAGCRVAIVARAEDGAWGLAHADLRAGNTRARIELRRPHDVELRLSSKSGPMTNAVARVRWESGDSRDAPRPTLGWHGEDMLPVRDGRLALRLPGSIPIAPRASPTPPAWLHLRVRVAGHEEARCSIELGAPGFVDAGTLELEPRTPQIVLARGHGMGAADLGRGNGSVSLHDGVRRLAFDVEEAVELADGDLAIHLWRDDERPSRFLTQGAPAEASCAWTSAEALLIRCPPGDRWIAFTNEGADRYARAAEREMQVDVALERWPIAGEELYVGWTWRRLDEIAARVDRGRVGDWMSATLRVPTDVDAVWWSTERAAPTAAGPQGRLQPVGDEGAIVVRIR